MDIMDEARNIAKETKKKVQKEMRKERIQQKVEEAGDWINRNAPTILAFASVAITTTKVATDLMVHIGRRVELADERNQRRKRERSCYDRSEGHYWNLKRKLTNADWAEINARKENGERLGDILNEMKVLKK